MSKFRVVCSILVSLLILSGCSAKKEMTNSPVTAAPVSEQETSLFTIAGSGSNIPLTQALLDAYAGKSGISIQIPKSIGTAGAVKALQAKELDLGLISRSLKDSEKDTGLKQKKYARIGIVFGAHPSVPDGNISTEDLLHIYDGTKNTWSNGDRIIVLIREEGDSSNKVLIEKIPGFKAVLEDSIKTKRWETLYTDLEASDAIKNTEDSIGLTDTAALIVYKQTIKPLSFNNVAPSLENVENQTYPLYKDLYFAYNEPLSAEALKFMDFVFSEEGRKVILDNGGIPGKGE